MSLSSAVDEIMFPHVGCTVALKGGRGASGLVDEIDGNLVHVDWGVYYGHYAEWIQDSKLYVVRTAKQREFLNSAREKEIAESKETEKKNDE